jgi:hypothetical protein
VHLPICLHWSQVELSLSLPEDEPCYDEKRAALFQVALNIHKRFRMPANQIPLQVLPHRYLHRVQSLQYVYDNCNITPQALSFLRIVCLNQEQLCSLATTSEPTEQAQQHSVQRQRRSGAGEGEADRMVECDELDDLYFSSDGHLVDGQGVKVWACICSIHRNNATGSGIYMYDLLLHRWAPGGFTTTDR